MIISSCDNLTQKKFEFFYYPARNVYYDVSGKLYLYSLDGGKTWDSAIATVAVEPSILGNKEIVYSTLPEVWMENDVHVKQYNGHVINIAGIDTGLSKLELAAERKAKKIREGTNTSNKTPEKKPGFFKRLFGKKNA